MPPLGKIISKEVVIEEGKAYRITTFEDARTKSTGSMKTEVTLAMLQSELVALNKNIDVLVSQKENLVAHIALVQGI